MKTAAPLPASRMRVATMLKRHGSATAHELARDLDLAPTTVRQHLDQLLGADLVTFDSVADGPGRPTLHYRLTQRGQELFPSQNGALFGELVAFLVREGYPGVLDAFFRQTWAARHEEIDRRIRLSGAKTLDERVAVLQQFLGEQGFLPEVEVDGDLITMRECNCPLSEGVRTTRLPCRLEAELLATVLERDIERVSYIPDGEPCCAYRFKKTQ